jgi:hypothetical protein
MCEAKLGLPPSPTHVKAFQAIFRVRSSRSTLAMSAARFCTSLLNPNMQRAESTASTAPSIAVLQLPVSNGPSMALIRCHSPVLVGGGVNKNGIGKDGAV